ncbi:MAG: 50S ribosomal protein L29 [Bacteroidetes bacterium]|jgi:large subunit ribosomal protein L29|nr:50S ribosomal protein L29 [Bacteroidota bacterium]
MESKEIRELSIKEIEERIENNELALKKMKLNHAVSPLDNPMKLKENKKTLARLKTILTEKQKAEIADS